MLCTIPGFLVALIWLLPADAARSAGSSAVYRETVPVASQSAADRRRAAGRGLATVLVRIAGTTQVLQDATVREALGRADGYLEQFSYRRSDPESDAQEPFELVLEFAPQATTALLRDAGLPVWSAKRPVILAWIELSDGANRGIITRTAPAQWAELVQEEARRRGLVVVLPASVSGLNAADVAQQTHAELIYRGFVRAAGPSCSSQWTLELDGAVEQWSYQGAEQRQCVARAVDGLAETLSARYAFAASASAAQVMLQVAGLRQFEDYSAIVRMLGELAVVSAVTVHSVAEDRVRFALSLRGNQDSLERAIRLEQLLIPSEPQPDTLLLRPVATPAVEPQQAAPRTDPAAAGEFGSDGYSVDTLALERVDDPAPMPASATTLYYRLQAQPL